MSTCCHHNTACVTPPISSASHTETRSNATTHFVTAEHCASVNASSRRCSSSVVSPVPTQASSSYFCLTKPLRACAVSADGSPRPFPGNGASTRGALQCNARPVLRTARFGASWVARAAAM